jgi:hypothetical protein
MIRSKALLKRPGTRWSDGPLLEAVINDDIAAVRSAIKSGSGSVDDVTWLYNYGAINFVKSHQVLTVLLESGITIDEQVLNHYLDSGNAETDFSVEVLERIIDAGAPINGQRDSIRGLHHKRWPIQYAIQSGNPKYIELLLRKGADSGIPFLPENITPLHWSMVYWDLALDNNKIFLGISEDGIYQNELINETYRKIVDLLIQHGADIESRMMSGHTPLLYAADNLSSEALFHMAKRGADLLAVDGYGNGVLSIADKRFRGALNLRFTEDKFMATNEAYRNALSNYYEIDAESGEIRRIAGIKPP